MATTNITAKEAGKLLGIESNSFLKLAKKEGLTSAVNKRKNYYLLSDVERLVAKRGEEVAPLSPDAPVEEPVKDAAEDYYFYAADLAAVTRIPSAQIRGWGRANLVKYIEVPGDIRHGATRRYSYLDLKTAYPGNFTEKSLRRLLVLDREEGRKVVKSTSASPLPLPPSPSRTPLIDKIVSLYDAEKLLLEAGFAVTGDWKAAIARIVQEEVR